MFAKTELKERAVSLRKKGFTLSEILKNVPVAKSTLSDWLRSVGLSKPQKQRITEKRIAAALRGSQARKQNRIALSNSIYLKSEKEIKKISKRELWLIGIALYWAEGSKEKEYHPGDNAKFSNSDPYMIRLFLSWLKKCCNISDSELKFEIYAHDTDRGRVDKLIEYWSRETGFSKEYFTSIYFKRNKINTKRKNIGNLYFGLVRVNIKRSSGLIRQIKGWVNGINKNCGIV